MRIEIFWKMLRHGWLYELRIVACDGGVSSGLAGVKARASAIVRATYIEACLTLFCE